MSESSGVPHPHHGLDYIEFVAPDLEAIQAFYTAAFDWRFTAYGPDYLGIQIAGREVGGFRRAAREGEGGPLVILFSQALEESLEAVRRAGGEITEAIFDFPGGRRFHFRDPAGNLLGVWGDPL